MTTLAHHLTWQGKHDGSPSDLWLHQLWSAAGERAPRYIAAALMTTAAAAPYLAATVLSGSAMNSVLIPGTIAVVVVAWRASRRAVDLRRLHLNALHTSAGRRLIGRLFTSGGNLGLKVGLAFGVLYFPVNTFTEKSLVQGLWSALWAGVLFGITFGFAGGLASALGTQPPAIDRPSRLIQQGLVHLAVVIVAVYLMVGLVMGLWFGLLNESIAASVVGLSWAIYFGLPFGFVFVANSPWPRYLVATIIVSRRGDLPRRPAVFLNWSYEAGLMRLSGIAVQFRHRDFQTWLVTHGQPADGHATVVTAGPAATNGDQGIAQASPK